MLSGCVCLCMALQWVFVVAVCVIASLHALAARPIPMLIVPDHQHPLTLPDEQHRKDAERAAWRVVAVDPAVRQQHAHRQPVQHPAQRRREHARGVPREAHRETGIVFIVN